MAGVRLAAAWMHRMRRCGGGWWIWRERSALFGGKSHLQLQVAVPEHYFFDGQLSHRRRTDQSVSPKHLPLPLPAIFVSELPPLVMTS